MSILEVSNLKFSYKDNILFSNLNLRLMHDDHLGLIGMNGVGKTTLLKLIAERLHPDEGTIRWLSGVDYSYLDQHLEIDSKLNIREYLASVYDELFEVENRLNALYKSLETADPNDYDKILRKADNLMHHLEENDFYLIKSKIENVINGLGVKADLNFPLRNLSGGERIKIFLAKLLLEEKDVLLLDEPTNFLDEQHIEWLAKYLVNYPKAFIVVSHNPAFLNLVCNKIAEIHNKQLNVYKGNYDAYLKQKELKEQTYLTVYKAQQKFIKKTEEYIKKNIARASTAKQAKSRQKVLEKIEKLEKPVKYKKVKFDFPFTSSFQKEAIVIKDLEIGYDHPLLPKINLIVRFGEKIRIVGKNGVGKTTFLKTVLGLIKPISGRVNVSELNKIIYYSQEFKDDKTLTPIEYVRNDYPLMTDEEIRSLLARYGVVEELPLKPFTQLSGGEIAKVRLAHLSLESSNMLILDEPTNHLDVIAKKGLYQALREYPGTIILVSHEKEVFHGLKMNEIVFG